MLFRRTLPKRKPYWSTPGGGVDPEDVSVEDALHRELAEELGAVVDRVQQVYVTATPRGEGVNLQHFFLCRLVSMDLDQRTGSEFSNPAKGRYAVERIDLRGRKLARYDLQPAAVRDYIVANRQVLLATALSDGDPPLMRADVPTAPADTATPADRPAAGEAPPPILEIVDGEIVGDPAGRPADERPRTRSWWDRLRRRLPTPS